MPLISEFRKCNHSADDTRQIDWRECFQCLSEVEISLTIARAYLEELAKADFDDNGICKKPLKEPIQGRGFQQIAATALSIITR